MYKSRTHLRVLKDWQPAHVVLQRLEGSGFDLLSRINMDYRVTIDFLLALVDSYSIELSYFIISEERIAPTLEDVARITGFPIDGMPVTGCDYKAAECSDICNELVLSARFLHEKNKCDIIIKELLHFKDISLDIVGAGLDPYVRAYVLYVIGCFLMPPRDSRLVPCMYLSLLRNADAIRNYAWGAALLCHLYHSLREFKMTRINGKNPKIMSFCAPFLTVGWSQSVERKSRNCYNKKKREEFDLMLTSDNIMWRPYARLRDDFLPNYLIRQMSLALSCTILICFEKLAYHRLDLCPLKLNL
ncbi:protein MAIN-LIKE 1-like [Olea europaea var. sylvestris]|uniref:protein MAIN-LIKE 1-like n=1 Tax=Olea europaea var. sylvestris TaxID=158386 RepID=UPI000C1D0B3A|nr:protein MAIN-LIKE 1-like [Olea europaea var. sylvestris]XP_022845449.1 protein MAIN-LIKE 1-like [Olea europaea var. sylvestris]XP_022845450.1 protein MAIN-LIKE 1-like [Olea europaea var. sylvestris]XP_022845451.1 protein MAIN-LIKE 1-like [Olea europaea var. sylvestris]XP_022845452.1 protein MAIN-LIKE 1-like [Olea europaea var. sylvestris]XP_022845454.1 protein MAIN-LIKE 1-like [Olea europaea var. sylvestris]XP_022845455.1 protein MAIN-LIKE 1-like [Olea europaea var. sylvestris]XP_02284545